MILDSRAVTGPTAGQGVVGTTTAGTGHTTAGSIAPVMFYSGSTEMACGPLPHAAPRSAPQRAIHCASGKALNNHGQRVVQMISSETGENVQITMDVMGVVRVILPSKTCISGSWCATGRQKRPNVERLGPPQHGDAPSKSTFSDDMMDVREEGAQTWPKTGPEEPSVGERAWHELTHFLPASWCRTTDTTRNERTQEFEALWPKIQVDYFFMRSGPQAPLRTCMSAVDPVWGRRLAEG